MNASSRYREVKSFILNIYCNCSKHCIKMHTDYIHKYCILLKYRYVLERPKLPLRNKSSKNGISYTVNAKRIHYTYTKSVS